MFVYSIFFELNDLNGQFRSNAYNSVCWACLVCLAPKREKKEVPFGMAIGKLGTHARVFSQTLGHGNSKTEIKQRTDEEGKKKGESMERSKAGTK